MHVWYVILGRDIPGSGAQRRALRPAHLERLRALQEAGRLLVAGPMPAVDSPEPGPAGFVGSALIAEFASQTDALAWAEQDPYRLHGVWSTVEVLPFLRVF
jgi:uncharacterized protein YciI